MGMDQRQEDVVHVENGNDLVKQAEETGDAVAAAARSQERHPSKSLVCQRAKK